MEPKESGAGFASNGKCLVARSVRSYQTSIEKGIKQVLEQVWWQVIPVGM